MFLLYEAAGIVANVGGGYFASRYGIPRMLAVGQILQIAGLVMQQVSGFLAAWTIVYGGIQAVAPSLVTRSPDWTKP
jgi:predicted MFS family arabinose efflux permease